VNEVETTIPEGSAVGQHPGRDFDWMPLLIVIGAVFLFSAGTYYVGLGWGSDYEIDYKINLILGFLADTVFVVTIALVVYSRVDQAKKLLVVGILIVVLLLAIRTEVYLRAF
jgi:hypothetical protein